MSRYLSLRELEMIADKVTQKYFQLFQATPGLLFPIDPVLLAEEIVHLNVRFLPLCSDGSVLGLTAFDDIDLCFPMSDGSYTLQSIRKSDVVIDTGLQENGVPGRCNFTIAHETGHQILFQLFPADYGNACNRKSHIMYRRKKESHNWVEWQADSIASFLMMPRILISESMYRFGLGEKVEMLNRVFRPAEYQRFCDMATYLGVSKQALSIRLKQLGYLDKDRDYLANPYELLRIYCDDSDLQHL